MKYQLFSDYWKTVSISVDIQKDFSVETKTLLKKHEEETKKKFWLPMLSGAKTEDELKQELQHIPDFEKIIEDYPGISEVEIPLIKSIIDNPHIPYIKSVYEKIITKYKEVYGSSQPGTPRELRGLAKPPLRHGGSSRGGQYIYRTSLSSKKKKREKGRSSKSLKIVNKRKKEMIIR